MAERDGFGGIGRIRDIGDPYDSRRGNPRPQRYFSSKEELEDFIANEELNRRAAAEVAELSALQEAARVSGSEDPTGVRYKQPIQNQMLERKGRLGREEVVRKILPAGVGSRRVDNLQQDTRVSNRAQRIQFLELNPNDASQVLSQSAGREVPPEFAKRVQQYLTALPELDVRGAAYLAEQERAPGGLSREALQRLAQSGEIGADPAISAVAKAANEGVIDETRPIESQARAVDPYMKATTDEKTRLIDKYKDMANAAVGVKPKRAAEIINPYLVPALMAEASQEYTNKKTGISKRQPATYWDTSIGSFAIEPRNVRLELLDPSALISDKTAASLNLAYRNRETGELTSPTLGGAINTLMQENRTPLIAIPDKLVKGGKFRGQKVSRFGDSGEQGYGDYRVGNTSAYKDEMYSLINDLLEKETGMQLVTNQGIRDEKMGGLQKALLARTSTNPAITDKDTNPTTELINSLAEGRNIDRNLGSQDKGLSILATSRAQAEKDFYLQEGYQAKMQQYRNEAAIAQGSSNQPLRAEVKTSSYAYDNAPQAPSTTAPSTNNAVQSVNQANIPAGSRPTTEKAPAFQRAIDFLSRYRRGKGI
jgi:Spy/CpxP family protein refolding chaperone